MTANVESTAFERGIEPVLQLLLPAHAAEVVSFQSEPSLSKRIEELAAKSTAGELTSAEREEYAGNVRANKFIAVLRRQARRILAG